MSKNQKPARKVARITLIEQFGLSADEFDAIVKQNGIPFRHVYSGEVLEQVEDLFAQPEPEFTDPGGTGEIIGADEMVANFLSPAMQDVQALVGQFQQHFDDTRRTAGQRMVDYAVGTVKEMRAALPYQILADLSDHSRRSAEEIPVLNAEVSEALQRFRLPRVHRPVLPGSYRTRAALSPVEPHTL